MTTTEISAPEKISDAELVTGSLGGNREAFRQIVERYQTLICSVAYGATGNVSQSEDLAQETFITAWGNLRLLREPGKLRAWLCGIVRHRSQKYWGRAGREVMQHAAPLAAAEHAPAPEALPSDQAVTRDEEAIMWRALVQIPEIYREPLILFYREHQSIARVAAALELSEEVVKQRLSRGRKLLQEEVQAFVESALTRTAPKPAFSHAGFAALPFATGPAAAAGWGAAAKGAATAKAGLFTVWLAPLIGSMGGIAAQWLAIRATTSDRRLRVRKITRLIAAWFLLLGVAVGGDAAVDALGRHFEWSARFIFSATAAFWWCYACALSTWIIAMIRPYFIGGEQAAGPAEIAPPPMKVRDYIVMVAGVNVSLGSWLAYLAWLAHDGVGIGIIAATMFGLGLWQCCHVLRRTGLSAARVSLGHTALAGGAVVVIFNLRFAGWVAVAHSVSVTEISRQLPMWLIPVLTIAWLAWTGLAIRWSNRKRGMR